MSVFVMTRRHRSFGPAMTMVFEFENVVASALQARFVVSAAEVGRTTRGSLAFAAYLSVRDLILDAGELAAMRRKGCRVVVYLFDPFTVRRVLTSGRYRLLRTLTPFRALERSISLFCLPFRQAVAEVEEVLAVPLLHLPLGVDTTLPRPGATRPLDVLAYGRQPHRLLETLSGRFNMSSDRGLFYHTNTLEITKVTDAALYRQMFWKVASQSKIAINFDPYVLRKGRYVSYPVVGQRWFETFAAGCAVAGRAPETPEFDELFDWPEPVLPLPEDPEAAADRVVDFLSDPSRLHEIGRRNRCEVRRHDWRRRLATVLERLGTSPPESLMAQIAAAEDAP